MSPRGSGAAAAASLLLAVSLGACGTAAAAGSADHRGPTPAPLAASAVPGWGARPPGRGIWADVEAGAAARCLGIEGQRPVAQQPSPVLAPAHGLVGRWVASEVVTFATSAAADRVGRALASQASSACLQGPLERSLVPATRAAGLHLATPQVTPLDLAPAGTSVSFGQREVVDAEPTATDEQLVAVYTDVVGFVRGRRLAELQTVSEGQLFPEPIERRLVADLGRAPRRGATGAGHHAAVQPGPPPAGRRRALAPRRQQRPAAHRGADPLG